MGDHPKIAPTINGLANYTKALFPNSAPTLTGKVTYYASTVNMPQTNVASKVASAVKKELQVLLVLHIHLEQSIQECTEVLTQMAIYLIQVG